MKMFGLALVVMVSLVAAPATAQTQTQGSEVEPDPLFDVLFPPELIMQHRRAIGLTDGQRDDISDLIRDTQRRVVDLQWELLDRVEELTNTMSSPRVDLDRALDQLDEVLDTERDIKESHLEMLIRVKNLLSPDQQARLEELRDEP